LHAFPCSSTVSDSQDGHRWSDGTVRPRQGPPRPVAVPSSPGQKCDLRDVRDVRVEGGLVWRGMGSGSQNISVAKLIYFR